MKFLKIKFLVAFLVLSSFFITTNANTIKASSYAFIKPVNGGYVTAGFMDPSYKEQFGFDHYGVDYGHVNRTGTPILASAGGTVSKVAVNSSLGNYVHIKHNVNGSVYTTVYAHLDSISTSLGKNVSQGEVIGTMGSTGFSTGPHLHFELHIGEWIQHNGVNPLLYVEKLTLLPIESPDNNPYNGSFGTGTVDYNPNYGVNVYDAPNGAYKGKVQGGKTFMVYKYKDGYYDLGNSTWIKEEYLILKRYKAYVNFPDGYEVNVYDGPNGAYKGKITGGTTYTVFAEKDGWYDLGQSTWVKGEYVIIRR